MKDKQISAQYIKTTKQLSTFHINRFAFTTKIKNSFSSLYRVLQNVWII